MYVYIGQYGVINGPSTYNGGGKLPTQNDPNSVVSCSSGDGATDIRLDYGPWSSTNSLKSRIMVAAGGAGKCEYFEPINGGDAGIFEGFNGTNYQTYDDNCFISDSRGATATSGGIGYKANSDGSGTDDTFGIGGFGLHPVHGSGGGGGYYAGGGGGFCSSCVGSGSGGSSFVSGYPGFNSVAKNYSDTNKVHRSSPVHYSNLVFRKVIVKSGRDSFNSPSGKLSVGNSGHGFARIEVLELYASTSEKRVIQGSFYVFFDMLSAECI